MPSYRLSQHAMDVIFKLEAQQLGSALARRFGLDLPPVVRYVPTDLPIADVHLEQLDSVFELDDGHKLALFGPHRTKRRHQTADGNVGFPARDCSRGAAWLSSARVVRCWVKSRNERNPCPVLLTP